MLLYRRSNVSVLLSSLPVTELCGYNFLVKHNRQMTLNLISAKELNIQPVSDKKTDNSQIVAT